MRKRSGFALAMVLWISAVLMAATLFLLSNYKKSVVYASDLQDKLEAEIEADTYITKFNYYALTGKFQDNYIENSLKGFPKKLFLNQTPMVIDKNTTLVLKSGGGMLSMYATDASVINNMMQNYTHSTTNYKDAYLDWIDLDNVPLLNGAEDGYYIANGHYPVSNLGTIQHPEELFLIKGFEDVNDSIRQKVIENFHYTTSSTLDYAVISPDFLRNLIKVDDFEWQQLAELYKNNYSLYKNTIVSKLSRSIDSDYFGISYVVHGVVVVNIRNSSVRREFDILFKNYHQRPFTVYRNQLTRQYIDLSKKKL